MSQHYPEDIVWPALLSWITPSLAMGARPDTYKPWDAVVSCERHLARKPMEGYAGIVLHVPMDDDDAFDLDDGRIGHACAFAESVIREGGRVLVHCSGGLNRSGVVVATILTSGAGMDPRDAIRLMRAKRSEHVLCNRAFERWVLGERLPTAETSMFARNAEMVDE